MAKNCVVCALSSTEIQECGHALHAACKSKLKMFKLRCVGCIPKGSVESKYAANSQVFIHYLDQNEKWVEFQKEALPPCRKLANIVKGYEALQPYPPATCALGRMYHYGHGVPENNEKALDLFLRSGDYALAKQCAGVIYSGRKQYAEAIQAYTESIALEETHEAFLNRGSMYMSIGEEEKSYADMQKVLELCPDDARAISNLGSWHLRFYNATETALNLFKKAVKLDPTLVNARTVLAKLLVMKGDKVSVLEGEALFRSIMPPTLVSITSLVSLLAHKFSEEKNQLYLMEAMTLVKGALEMCADEPDAHCSLADIYVADGRKDLAEKTYRFILSRWEHYSTLMNLATTLSTKEYDPEVEALYRRAIRLDPGNLDAVGVLAIYLFTSGEFDQARGLLDEGLRLDPRNPDFLFYRGIVLLHDDPENSGSVMEYFQRALAVNPEHSLANYHMARLTADPTAALGFLAKAAKYDPFNADKWVQLGSKYYVYAGGDLGRLVSAVTSFERARKIRPDYKINNHIADCWYAIGMHHVKNGDMPRAMRAFFKVDTDCYAYEQAAEEIAKFKAA